MMTMMDDDTVTNKMIKMTTFCRSFGDVSFMKLILNLINTKIRKQKNNNNAAGTYFVEGKIVYIPM